MSILSVYGGINAKVKAMRSRLLNYDDYVLLTQSRNVADFADKLKEHQAYEKELTSIGSNVHRSEIERKVVFSLSSDFSRIYSFISDDNLRNYLNAYFLNNEIKMINHILTCVLDEREMTYTLPELSSLIKNKFHIDIPKLIDSKNLFDFVENLKGTDYYTVLSTNTAKTRNLFVLEMKLDVYYYIHLWKLIRKNLDKTNRLVMERITGTEIDLRNIIWIYRLKTYYNINETDIYTSLIPINHKLTKETITKMVESKSKEELLGEIYNSPYSFAFNEETPIESSFYIALSKVYNSQVKKYPESLALVVDFIYRKEIEIKNIISLLECIRYSLKQDEILKYLILPKEKR